MAPHYKLTYFDLRGRAEAARQIFAVADVKFEDVRIQRDDWPKVKPTTPFGQVPLLEVDGQPIAQSVAIMRFLGKTFNLAGKSALEDAKIDMLVDQIGDLSAETKPYLMVLWGFAEGDKDKLKKEVFVPARDKHFNLLKKHLSHGFILGDRLTWADIYIAETLASVHSKIPDALQGFPEIEAYIKKVQSNPKIRKHIETRPDAPL